MKLYLINCIRFGAKYIWYGIGRSYNYQFNIYTIVAVEESCRLNRLNIPVTKKEYVDFLRRKKNKKKNFA